MSDWLLYTGWFVAGIFLGSQLNHAIYRWAWHTRQISPWFAPDPEAPARSAWDRLPILGWYGLRREITVHGKGFWVRPMLLEIAVGVGLAAMYWWELGRFQEGSQVPMVSWVDFLAHVTLFSLLVIATFIDFDEQTIPDLVTIPGTLIALVLAGMVPTARLSTGTAGEMGAPLLVTSPFPWDAGLEETMALLYGCTCLLGWCLAVTPKLCTRRYGWCRGLGIMVASMVRPPRGTKGRYETKPRRPFPVTRILGWIALAGPLLIAGAWATGGPMWQGLFSALVGMAFGGALVWGVRLVGGYAMQQEAMGFGDVTLMAMIGAFLGWQASLVVFFLAPFAALLIGLIQWICIRRTDLAFGPYLSLAAMVLVVGWHEIWNVHAQRFFQLGWAVPMLVLVCLVLMGILLVLLQWLKRALRGSPGS